MATIHNEDGPSPANFMTLIRQLSDSQLLAQDFVQQGAVHAISFLLRHGCNEATAGDMLASLRENARLIREEAARRGKPQLFERDQTVFS